KGMQEELKSTEAVTVHTFHAFCAEVLREDGHLVGIDEGFDILLPDDAKVVLHKDLGITPYWANRYISTIMSAKDFGISRDQFEEYADGLIDSDEHYDAQKEFLQTFHLFSKEEQKAHRQEKKDAAAYVKQVEGYRKFQDFLQAWGQYDEYKKKNSLLDYSDLNDYTLQLFRRYGADKYVEQFKYVFVDEFQDTNKLQFELITFIAAHHNITVVGDLNQSIYGFRGSYKESFEHFKEVFHADESCIFKLDQGRRCPDTILAVSYELIKNNYENPDDCVHVKNFEGRKGNQVQVTALVNAEEEARFIAEKVQEKIDTGMPKEEICILHRTHKQAEIIKKALELKGIPVISAGKIDLLQKPEIKTAIAYLSILNNLIERTGTGEQAWWHLFHYKNTLSPEDSVKMGRYIKKINPNGTPLLDQKGIDEILLNAIDEVDLSSEAIEVIHRIVEKLREIMQSSVKSVPDLVLDVYEVIGLNRAFSFARSVENIEAMLNLKKFHELASEYYERHDRTLCGFVNYLEIIDALGVNVDASRIMHIDAVRMMTIHAAKGLEFDCVIVCNMAKDRFPVGRTPNEPLIPKELLPDFKAQIDDWREEGLEEKEIEKRTKAYDKEKMLYEERRLCYVAFTRAKQELVLTFARDYKGEPDSTAASAFLHEIQYQENSNVVFTEDTEERSMILAPNSHHEQHKSSLKEQLIMALDTESYDDLAVRLAKYLSCREGEAVSPEKVDISDNILQKEIDKAQVGSLLKFDSKSITFSPSSLNTYMDCPKRYELSQIYHMPERGDFDGEGGGATLGSFVHKVCEIGVRDGYFSLDQFLSLADSEHKGDFASVDLDEAKRLLNIFWKRNKNKYNENSKVELKLSLDIDGFRLNGKTDRIDEFEDSTIEIIDYKTNKKTIEVKKRNIQLGFYALALLEKGYKVSKLTLDMLKLDKPLEMTVDGDEVKGSDGRTKGFRISEVKKEIRNLCKSIARDYETEFKEAEDENKCRFCGYKFYCKKWEE
ncbi:MAG: ATP-dependent helicase, partial [Nanoarchaeota archaeon]